jgi:hypothetical protein
MRAAAIARLLVLAAFVAAPAWAQTTNQLFMTGAASGTEPSIQATGVDTNISVILTPKGTGGVGIGTTTAATSLTVAGPISLQEPAAAITATTYTQLTTDSSLIFAPTATTTVTLLAPGSYPGQILHMSNRAAFTVISASANVMPQAGGTHGTAILPATAGAWVELQSNGTDWVIMESGGTGGTVGSTTQIAFNNAGTESGSSDFTWNDSTKTLTVDAANTTGATVYIGTSGANTNKVNIGPTTGAAAPTTPTVSLTSGVSGVLPTANGGTGTTITSMGACTVASFTAASGANAETCTGIPTGVAVNCSPSASQGTTVTWGSRASASGTVTINMSAAGAAATWYCMWVKP